MNIKFTRTVTAFTVIAALGAYSPTATDGKGFNWLNHMIYTISTAALHQDMDMDMKEIPESQQDLTSH